MLDESLLSRSEASLCLGNCLGFFNFLNFLVRTNLLKLRKGSKTRAKSQIQKEEKLKQGEREGEAAVPALKPPYPEYTFVLGGFLIALPRQPEQC